MGLEVEKKYRLPQASREPLRVRLERAGAFNKGREFEENTLFEGPGIDINRQVLRVRRTLERAVLTYKERQTDKAAIRRQREDETEVADPDALISILETLGYRAALVYEKRRETWKLPGIEVVIDELAFGWFVELEGEEGAILQTEQLLNLSNLETEYATYPELAALHGVKEGALVAARFAARRQAPLH